MTDSSNGKVLQELWLCFTYNRKGKFRPIKIVHTLKEAKAWSHYRVDKIIEMEKLRANYELRIDKTRVSQKYYSAWHKFAKENNLFMNEQRHSPDVWRFTIDLESQIWDSELHD